MALLRPIAAKLVCSVAPAPKFIRGIDAKVDASQTGVLYLCYTLNADMRQLLVAQTALPGRVDGLWQHTCFEAFVALKDSPAYYEFNFSPSGEWAAYGFRAYRDRGPVTNDALAPNISVERRTEGLTLAATLRWDHLSLFQPGAVLRIGLSAAIEAADGTLSYWALKHPAKKPDFHHADSFALELALPANSA